MSGKEDASSKKIAEGALRKATVDRIVSRMEEKRLSQAEVGEATGIHQTGISAILNRTRRPYFDQMCRLAWFLDLSIDYLAADAGVSAVAADKATETADHELSDEERFLVWLLRRLGTEADEAAMLILKASRDPANASVFRFASAISDAEGEFQSRFTAGSVDPVPAPKDVEGPIPPRTGVGPGRLLNPKPDRKRSRKTK